MAKLSGEAIRDVAVHIVTGRPEGIRYSELKALIVQMHPETPANSIGGAIWDLEVQRPDKVVKPSRGIYVPAEASHEGPTTPPEVGATKLKEEQFYRPFAEWLQRDLNEATIALPIGGAGLRTKWGTPDVVGVYKPRPKQMIKFAPEIIAAEIKIDPQSPVVAFGQAVAYRLFATKAYVVMPKSISAEDQGRLEALCMLFGIGLVFVALDPANPDFEIRVRAQRTTPDMFYVNEFADRLSEWNASAFEQLFG